MKTLDGRPGHTWAIIEDTDGHRWLLSPDQRMIASFTAECDLDEVKNVGRVLQQQAAALQSRYTQ